jgi:hypothetical protein
VGVFHLSGLATAVTQESELTRKQKRLLKIQSKISPEPANTFAAITSTSDTWVNVNVLQWLPKPMPTPFQNTQSLPVEPTFQRSSTSALTIPSGQTKAGELKAMSDHSYLPH